MQRRIALLLLLALALLAVGCAPDAGRKQIHLGIPGRAQTSPATETARAPLRVAVAAVISPEETFRAYQDLLRYIGSKLDRPVELVQRKTYAEINNVIRDGGIDLAFVCTLAYVKGQEEFGMELLAAPQVRGEATYRAYIIVPTDSPVTQLAELRGKVFAFSDPDSNTGRLVPTYLLWQMGHTPEGFFRKAVYTYSHDNSIKAVADKLVDGASVDSLVYDYTAVRQPELAARTRIIFRSDSYGAPPAVVHPGLAGDLKEQLREVILGLDADPEGRAILHDLMIDRFVVPPQAAYDPIRAMLWQMRGQ